ncbi:MAG TPA: class A beta-lactamase-related serine hydrolase [Candidatus Corynebacterium avicola]|uniref:Class A beta-lactamase-related serine hydrolase n=1 Tax=Candidatus Corynebacterium avicola TaxID=2838527 RepID=A0A9D1UM82_9CORY|nr:class A beta-lactamase-related serine hydrolase [Candidatus Corynebacterium avicola]
MTVLRADTRDLIRTEFTTAGCDGWVWAQHTGQPSTGRGLGGTHIVPTASMYKMHLLGAACLSIDEGLIDPTSRVTVSSREGPRGGVGFGWYDDDIEVSVRDLMRQMVMVSDNVAAHRLFRLIEEDAPGAVNRLIDELDLRSTNVVDALSAASDHAAAGRPGTAEQDAVQHVSGHPGAESDAVAYRSTSTAQELCALIDWFWSGTPSSRSSPSDRSARSLGRTILGQQAWLHRIPSGFPASGVSFHGKTGTIGAFRGETSVITVDDEPPVTVCVMTRAARPGGNLPTVDTSIGRVARILVDELRSER